MRAIAVDTTTAWGSVAVVGEAGLEAELRLAGVDTHSRTLLPGIGFLLAQLGLGTGDVDVFVVATGPGSFTGLRVGIATVQGLALAAGVRCVGVPTLDAHAWRARGAAEHLVAVVGAHAGDVYARLYDADARPVGEPRVGAPEVVLAGTPEQSAFVGDAVAGIREAIAALCPGARFPPLDPFLAESLGRAGLAVVAAGGGVPPGELRACYVRPPRIRPPA